MPKHGVPVLMYHSLLEQPVPDLHRVHILQEKFAEQMEWLAANSYVTLTPDQVLEALSNNQSLPERGVILTFDDGYYSLYKFALPLLARLNFVATLFVTTDWVGLSSYTSGSISAKVDYPLTDRPLNWAEIEELARNGWAIESHTCTHPYLSQLKPEQVINELVNSKNQIEQQLSRPVRHLAYPYGNYNYPVLEAVKAAGYRSAFTTHTGKLYKADLTRLPRIEINSGDELLDFRNKVETGFASPLQQFRAKVRNVAYASPRVKDFLKSLVPQN